MDVIIFASYGSYTSPYGRNLLSEIGKKSILQLPEYSSFEAIIALPGSFDINGMDREFYELVKTNASCPVILLQTGHPDFYTISAENRDTMYKMTRHFFFFESEPLVQVPCMDVVFNDRIELEYSKAVFISLFKTVPD